MMRIFGRGRPEPVLPENVHLVRTDGGTVPLDCVYVGYHDGTHMWTAMIPAGFSPDQVRIDTLPAHTSIRFELLGMR